MKDLIASVVVAFALVVLILGLSWLVQGNNFFLYKTFAPKYEAARRDTFEQSKAYRQGMVQELENMQFQYVKAGRNEKAALRSIILHRAADVPADAIPGDLAAFIHSLKESQ